MQCFVASYARVYIYYINKKIRDNQRFGNGSISDNFSLPEMGQKKCTSLKTMGFAEKQWVCKNTI